METTFMITGTSRGIGLALTEAILKKGIKVLATARSMSSLQHLQQKYPALLELYVMDVSDDKSVAECFAAIKKAGVQGIDVLINNAGVYGQNQNQFSQLNMEIVLETFNVNSIGPMRVIQKALPFLQMGTQKKVVSISSLMGSIADNQSGGSYDYRMSKAALNMFHVNFAQEFPQMISLLLHPGWVQTDMGGPHAPVKVEESAHGLLKVIIESGFKDSGKFYDYKGRTLPW